MRSSGSDYDPILEGAAGEVSARAVTFEWSKRLGAVVWWEYEVARSRWAPKGVEAAVARKLRLEVSDAHGGVSVEEVFAIRLEGACPS